MAHPLRLRILSLLTGVELSAAEVARELGITQANASYHLRLLADVGQLQVSGTEKVRGGVAKKYRYVAATDIAAQEPGAPAQDAVADPTAPDADRTTRTEAAEAARPQV